MALPDDGKVVACDICEEYASIGKPLWKEVSYCKYSNKSMKVLPDTSNCGLRMRQECRERFPRHRGLTLSTCITARAWRTCSDTCWDRFLADSFEVGVGENFPGIPSACTTRNFTYLVRGLWSVLVSIRTICIWHVHNTVLPVPHGPHFTNMV